MAERRTWTSKTLARELAKFIREEKIDGEMTAEELFARIKNRVVVDEMGGDPLPFGDLDVMGDGDDD